MNIKTRLPIAALLLTATLTVPAHAVSKDMIQLQTQIQQLQDAVARLQQSNDERMGVLKDLVQQTADSVNRMSVTVGGLQQKMSAQSEAGATKSDQLSGQIQSLNDSIDELKARLAKLDRAVTTIEGQQQSLIATVQALPTGGSTPASTGPINPPPPQQDLPLASNPAPRVKSLPPLAQTTAPTAGPSSNEMYRTAYSDYMSAKYPLAESEFTDLIKTYPDDNLAGNAYYYLGEIDTRTARPTAAVKNYDHVLEHYPDNAKIPAAHLHKGEAMLSMKQTDGGVRELRALIQRFPNSPEAVQARNRLSTMNLPVTPRR